MPDSSKIQERPPIDGSYNERLNRVQKQPRFSGARRALRNAGLVLGGLVLAGATLEAASIVTQEPHPTPDQAHIGQRASLDITINNNELFPHFRKTPAVEGNDAQNGPNVFTSGEIKAINGTALNLKSGEKIIITNPTTVTQVDENLHEQTWEVFKVNTDTGVENAYVRLDDVDLENISNQEPQLTPLTTDQWNNLPPEVNVTQVVPPHIK